MRSSIRSLAIVLSTVAAVVVVPVAVDLRSGAGVDDPTGIVEATAAGVAERSPGHGAGVSGPPDEPFVRSVFTPVGPSDADGSGSVGTGVADPGASVPAGPRPLDAVAGPASSVVPPATPVVPVMVERAEVQIDVPPSAEVTVVVVDAGGTGRPDPGIGSGMGGDLPPGNLPAPPYPHCPITAAGAWWTDPADPYTCIPPASVPWHEPTPPGIDPELLEPIVEVEAPPASVPWHEPTPPGIDPELLEPIVGVEPQTGFLDDGTHSTDAALADTALVVATRR
ncbi:hypothetical protein ASF21_15280 [Arthrobacter sp. Leaf234]|uniref:hypothetical protein n=1 Tax=Arthrobacter sp. Leaf234 TaxID=1736303 RepID=UPI0006FFABD2|nr:hypothetical protein [Arthrobacter sp. Leaf234]KQN96725.1 hypothetical protein ASF21_15280 [Arthrobacter sp. Leaf234]